MKHSLKILPEYFNAIISGNKTFELRYNDRDFQVEDILELLEYDNGYTGKSCSVIVKYVLSYPNALKDNYVCMSIVIDKIQI